MPADKKIPKTSAKKLIEQSSFADSLKVASKNFGIPIHILKLAKQAGCPAFVGQRIRRDPLREWLADHPEVANAPENQSDAAELKRQKLANEVELSGLKIAKEKGDIIPRDEAKSEWARCLAIIEEEAKSLMEPDHYRVFIERSKKRIGEKEKL